MPPLISVIVAIAQNNVIGANNQLIWHIPEDLKRFKALTMGHHIIMGRKTYESIGRPLPKRVNIVVTRNPGYLAEGCLVAGSLEEALELCEGDDETFVIGGGELYRQALPMAHRLYITWVHGAFEGDTFFPELNPAEWKEVFRQEQAQTNPAGLTYTFVDLEKI